MGILTGQQGEFFDDRDYLSPEAQKSLLLVELISHLPHDYSPPLLQLRLTGNCPYFLFTTGEGDFRTPWRDDGSPASHINWSTAEPEYPVEGFVEGFPPKPGSDIPMLHLMEDATDHFTSSLIDLADVKQLGVYSQNASAALLLVQNGGHYIDNGRMHPIDQETFDRLEDSVKNYWPEPDIVYSE